MKIKIDSICRDAGTQIRPDDAMGHRAVREYGKQYKDGEDMLPASAQCQDCHKVGPYRTDVLAAIQAFMGEVDE